MKLRSGVLAGLLLLGLAAPQAVAAADDYPQRQIKIIVPFPAGAGPDQVARMLGQHLQEAFGQTVLIENRAGALGSIGAQEVARSAPDGYTLLMGTNTTQAGQCRDAEKPALRSGQGFRADHPDRDHRDGADGQAGFSRPRTSPNSSTMPSAHPNMTAGYGSGASQISIGQLQSRGGLSVIAASYRGVPQAVTDVMAGAINLAFADFSLAIPQMQGGTLRGIGVTSPKRNELTPDLPALAEAMPGFEATIWYGLLAPAGTPDACRQQALCRERKIPDACRRPREKLASVGVIVSTMPPDEFGGFIRSEIVRWTADAKAAGIEAQ